MAVMDSNALVTTAGLDDYYVDGEFVSDTQQYFMDLFAHRNIDSVEFVYCGRMNSEKDLCLHRFLKDPYAVLSRANNDIVFTPCTFKYGKKDDIKRMQENIYAVYAWAIDVDYKKSKQYKDKKPEDIINFLAEEFNRLIPTPNYIEYGNQVRLIYILAEPLMMQSKKSASHKLIMMLKNTIKYFCTALNNEYDINAEPQKINSFFRMPGSLNVKTRGKYYEVKINKVSEVQYTIQELYSEWYKDTPSKVSNKPIHYKNNGHISILSANTLWTHRREMLELLAVSDNDFNREKLLFWWMQSKFWCEEDVEMQDLLDLNSKMKHPLPEKEIRSKFRSNFANGKKYTVKNSTICMELNVDEEEIGMLTTATLIERKCKQNPNLSAEDVAKLVGCTVGYVQVVRHKAGIKKDSEGICRRAFHENPNSSLKNICEITNCSLNTVKKYAGIIIDDYISDNEFASAKKVSEETGINLKFVQKVMEKV